MPLNLASGQIYNFDPFASGRVLGNNMSSPFGNLISQNPGLSVGTAPGVSTAPGVNRAPGGSPASIGSGSLFTGGGGTQGTGGNPNAGQPGSAGDPGLAKSVADSLTGLAMGFGPLGFGGSLLGNVGQLASNSPSMLGLLGRAFGFGTAPNPQGLAASAVTDPGMIADMAANPSAFGLSNAAVATTGQMTQSESPQQQAAMQAAIDAISGFSSGGAFGGTPGTGGLGSTGALGANASGATGGFGPSGFGTTGATGDTSGDIGGIGGTGAGLGGGAAEGSGGISGGSEGSGFGGVM